jgi:acetylornithine deacetylase/succinyl-diaminopimelate desuccinylase-like protein
VDNDALVRIAKHALEGVGEPARVVASSTDANAAMAAGVPAVAFGVYRGGDAHRTSEWLDPASLRVGFDAFARFMAALAGAKGAG